MANKTFISYKYSEAQLLRDNIISALGDEATYYKGETGSSPDLTDTSTENIKKSLTDMMYDTSVTIVIISPNMIYSKWIDWEIEYCLKEITRKNRTSRTNGVVGVVMKYNGGYSWLRTITSNNDGHTSTTTDFSKLYNIINNNRYNQTPKEYFCEECQTIDRLTGSFISIIEEEEFLQDPKKFINNAFEKSGNTDRYILSKKR